MAARLRYREKFIYPMALSDIDGQYVNTLLYNSSSNQKGAANGLN